jgi:membrane-associated phospholipid phosphatase
MFTVQYISDFGDQAVVLPLAVAIALTFALSEWRRGALAWTVAIGGTLSLILFLKLSFLACGNLMPEAHLRSPSGHTAAAAAVYGSLIATTMRSTRENKRWTLPCTVAIAVFVAVIFGASRGVLGVHSIAEVLIGGAIGVGGAVSYAVLAGTPLRAVRMLRVVPTSLLIVIVLHGLHVPAEAAIKSVAINLWPFSECIRYGEQLLGRRALSATADTTVRHCGRASDLASLVVFRSQGHSCVAIDNVRSQAEHQPTLSTAPLDAERR